MRLTLRTMLAYLDEILEPADAEELGKKIDESKFAGELVHRIRNSMRRLRLGVPKLEGKGMGLDPNTVAEYLDNTLPPDRVADFEKVCLESDVHLAEVASAHQILTLVLGEPAEIDPAVRQRVYRVGYPLVDEATGDVLRHEAERPAADQISSEPVAAAATQPTAAAADRPAATTGEPRTDVSPASVERARSQPEVPDYLRQTKHTSIWPLAMTLLLAFLLAAIALLAMGPLDASHPLLGPLFASRETEVAQVPSDTDRSAVKPPVVTPQAAEKMKADISPKSDVADDQPEEPITPKETKPVPPATTVPLDDRPVPPEKPVPPDLAAEVPPAPPKNGVAATGEPPASPNGLDTEPNDLPPAFPPMEPKDETESKPPVPSPPVDVGRYISGQQVILRIDPASGEWLRLPANAAVSSRDKLLVLPTYRPQIILTTGVQQTFVSASSFQLQPPADPDPPRLAMDYGRVFLVTVGVAGGKLGLDLGGSQSGVATFVDANTAMAVEVRNYRMPGANPETEPPQVVANLWTTSGRIDWEQNGEIVTVAAGQVRTFIDAQPGQTEDAGRLPDWVESTGLIGIDRIASQDLEPWLVPDRSIALSLKEQAQTSSRRTEIASLAVRCLSYLDQFEPFVPMLNDDRHKSSWESQFDALQDALARGPESSRQVRLAFEKLRGDAGPELYRMLWGYSPEQLEQGAAGRLVDYLDHESLDFRVLAFENLRRITGITHSYRPEATAAGRRSTVQRWRQRMTDIVYKTPPSPVPQRSAMGTDAR